MRRLLLLLMLSVATAMLLAASGVAAAQEEDVGPTDHLPLEEAPSEPGTVVAEEDPEIISTEPVDDAAQQPVNKDPGTNNDEPSTVENPKTGISIHCAPGFELVKGEDPSGQGDQCAPIDEEASASGDVKDEVVPEGIATTAPENDATSAPNAVSAPDEAGQIANSPTANSPTANSPTVHGCAYADDVYDEELDVCEPSDETLDFVSVVLGNKPWPDTAGEYGSFLGGIYTDTLMLLGVAVQGEGQLIEDFLDWYGEDGGPIGWGLQAVGYTVGLGSDVIGGLLQTSGQAADAVHEGLGAVVDTVADAAGDAWDEISSWF